MRYAAWELHTDGRHRPVEIEAHGEVASGWRVSRSSGGELALPPGYAPVDVLRCGVCSTDLARTHLPFALPQVGGHELLARTREGRRVVVEINASCAARGAAPCATCAAGLDRHCPHRLVLGIDRLDGGFAPHALVPVGACVDVPDAITDDAAGFAEPLAAALRALEVARPRVGDRVAVVGPRKLGLLIIAALRAVGGVHVTALPRRAALADRCRAFGADDVVVLDEDEDAGTSAPRFDLVFDTSGSPAGLATAIALARREVHLKSTHGRDACGLRHTTALVVDELALVREDRADAARSEAAIDDRIVPPDGVRRVSPCGSIAIARDAQATGPLVRAIRDRGLRLTSSRCGDLRAAIAALAAAPALQALLAQQITHRFAGDQLDLAFAAAASPDAIKVIVEPRAS
ncbi:MAG: alcohol dehydrogenase catalytic domain-containing protein [Deltaproteobacteria bacterium]|nr:alcohol dehydrogenase catalytic domain-containing protein [Deltaproteobacteria bacterium]